MTSKKISVVIPAYNEAAVIDIPIKRCISAFETYGYNGEVIIMDSSNDDTPKIATALGAKVVPTEKKGIGKAYVDALDHVSGDYIIMGDADGTYDFMEMNKFVSLLDEGYDFVMGSRLRGDIKKGAMPWSHRYIGTPILTFFINLFYGTKISDCNSGLRALTKKTYAAMNLQSLGWEYASEMVLKASRLNLSITEVPISLSPDQRNRTPHLNPWLAGYTNLRLIFMLVCDKLCLQLGSWFFIIGSLITIPLFFGPFVIKGIYFGMFYMFIGLILALAGIQLCIASLITKETTFLKNFQTTSLLHKIFKKLSFEKSLVLASSLFVGAFILLASILLDWLETGVISNHDIKRAMFSLYLIISGSNIFLYSAVTFLLNLKKQ